MNRIDLHDRVAVITGGAQGFGYATAQRMLDSGASVMLWDIDANRVEHARGELSARGNVASAVVELTQEDSIDAAVKATIERYGQIDILVNNAGITGGNGTTWELEPAIWKRTIEVNLIAPYLVCRAIVPHMIARRYGRIVNIASIAGKEGNANASHYSASKAGLIGLTKSLTAYNAGPTPAARWLSQRPTHDPDLWIETISYKETRDYVARVMAFSAIYDWLLNGDALPVSERMLGRTQGVRKRFACPAPPAAS